MLENIYSNPKSVILNSRLFMYETKFQFIMVEELTSDFGGSPSPLTDTV